MLARRALSSAELVERLERKGFPSEDVSREVRRLTDVQLLDDGLLARRLCEDGLARGRGRRWIRATLRRRKIPRAIAEKAVAAVPDGPERMALDLALERAEKRYPGWRDDRTERSKLYRYLAHRGFGLDEITAALGARRGARSGESGE